MLEKVLTDRIEFFIDDKMAFLGSPGLVKEAAQNHYEFFETELFSVEQL